MAIHLVHHSTQSTCGLLGGAGKVVWSPILMVKGKGDMVFTVPWGYCTSPSGSFPDPQLTPGS